MSHTVVFAPEAEEQLVALYRYIAQVASPAIAKQFTDAVIGHCEGLREFPHRAIRRDDIRPGLHLANYKGRVVIAFAVEPYLVSVIGIFYAGQDFEAILRTAPED